jgi:serine/threonine protein kinase
MTLASGTKLGRYEIRAQIGAGGMGEVYLALDSELDRTVALKILPAEVATNRERLRRFVQEAKAAAALNHAHIAHVYEIGEAEGRHFISMEYVEGLTLSARISGRPLPVDETVQLGSEIADALEEAHSKGITHRDLKPANIMITPRGQTKLLDFGLAKVRRSIEKENSGDATTQLKTAEGIVIGTVMYMSPEQALGQIVDHRSDIFSLGAVLYEMATGRLPFTGATATEIIDRIAHSQPEAISRLNYEVPGELERIIRKCLEKDKQRRYQSARELLVDLRNLKRDSAIEGVVAEKKTPARRSRIQPWMIAGLALPLVVLVGLGIYFLAHRGQPAETGTIDSIAVLPLVNASGDPSVDYLSDGITESVINSLSQLPRLRVVPRVSVFRYKGREVDPQKVGREMGVRAVLTGKVVQFGDTLTIQTELGKDCFGAQPSQHHHDLRSARCRRADRSLAYVHVALGQKDEAFVLLNKAYEERNSDLIDLKVDPQLDPLRSDPRFAEQLRRVGLAP